MNIISPSWKPQLRLKLVLLSVPMVRHIDSERCSQHVPILTCCAVLHINSKTSLGCHPLSYDSYSVCSLGKRSRFCSDKLWTICIPRALTTHSATLTTLPEPAVDEESWEVRVGGSCDMTSHPSWLPQAPAATSCCTLSKVQQADLAEPVMG